MKGIHVALEGRVTVQPDELKTTNTGKSYLNLALVVEVGEESTEFVRATTWAELAEELAGNINKGDSIYIEGRGSINRWVGADGVEKSSLNVSAWTAVALGKIGRKSPQRKEPGAASTWKARRNMGDLRERLGA